MPSINAKILTGGARIRIAVAPTAEDLADMHRRGLVNTPIVVTQAVIDTGASNSSISQRIIDELQLRPRSAITVRTPRAAGAPLTPDENCYVYSVNFHILGEPDGDQPSEEIILKDVFPIGTEICPVGRNLVMADCLIGRDILNRGILIYNGPAEEFTLSF